jgi:hypothetical protein
LQNNDEALFGPEYPTKNINYLSVLAKCPYDCHTKSGTVYGLGIHPENSPICLSALVDQAISYYGGLISILISPGLDNYSFPYNADKHKDDIISVQEYRSQSVKKSYVLSKVDNIDLVDKDIRILNHKGEFTNLGRVEIRINGRWGTICANQNDQLSAKLICKELNYLNGRWENPDFDRGNNFCEKFNEFNYCAAKSSHIYYEQIQCTDSDKTFKTCSKKLAEMPTCSHAYDAIIYCNNDSDEIINIPNGVVRLEEAKTDGDITTGQLEKYEKGKFVPVCDNNKSYTKDSANQACHKMGFEKVEQIMDTKMLMNEEGQIECQQVVLKCFGKKGDTTGSSQYMPKVANLPPQLKKLGLPYYSIHCETKGNHFNFRGDPGSVYLVECPPGCKNKEGHITGTGVFTSDTNICLAALQIGLFNDNSEERKFVLTKTFSQYNYGGLVNNGVYPNKLKLKWNNGSFSLSSLNSAWRNLNKVFLQSSQTPRTTIENDLLNNMLRNKDHVTSFLELSNSTLANLRYTYVEASYGLKFNDKNNVLVKEPKLGSLLRYTIILSFKFDKFKPNKQQVLFSYSECSGFNIGISAMDTLVLGDMCKEPKYVDTSIAIPENEPMIVYISYSNGKIRVIVRSEKLKEIEKVITRNLDITPAQDIGIGRDALTDTDHFFGEINLIQIFDEVIDPAQINYIIEQSKPVGAAKFKKYKTVDGRLCVSPCSTDPPQTGTPPPEAALDSGENFIIPPIKPNETENNLSTGTNDKEQVNNILSLPIDCNTQLIDPRFKGSIGHYFRLRCPKCENNTTGVVYGIGIYSPYSSICKAANHKGVLAPDQEGDVIIELTGPKEFFQEDVNKTRPMGKTDSSFRFKQAGELKPLACETTAEEENYSNEEVNTRHVAVCPQDCNSKKDSKHIYGTDFYTETSPICIAAIHAGVLSDKGGEIEFLIQGEQSAFKASKAFGILSQDHGVYLRSFSFLGQKSHLTYKFMEDYEGRFEDKWKIEIANGAIDQNKNEWSYRLEERVVSSNSHVEKFHTIKHTGTIALQDAGYNFSALVFLKNVDWVNGFVKFNLKMLDSKPVGFLFRYTNVDNYYAIYFDIENQVHGVKLISKVNGKFKFNLGAINIIDSNDIKLKRDSWYRCTLKMEYDSISFFIQEENIRQNIQIFKREIGEHDRGTIAFATNGKNYF